MAKKRRQLPAGVIADQLVKEAIRAAGRLAVPNREIGGALLMGAFTVIRSSVKTDAAAFYTIRLMIAAAIDHDAAQARH